MAIPFRRFGLVLGAVMVLGIPAGGRCDGASVELLVPAYFHPSDRPLDWPRLAIAAKTVPLTAILNPKSGPGNRLDPAYVQAVRAVRRAGGRVIGYVRTYYGDRPLTHVIRDVNTYMRFYDIDGFFIDEMTDEDSQYMYAYYNHIYNYIKMKNSRFRVIGNPGASSRTQGGYFAHRTADALVIFEDPYDAYSAFAPYPWTRAYRPSTLGQIILGAPGGRLKQVFARARSLRAGLLYITDEDYDRLPSYWQTLVALAAAAE